MSHNQLSTRIILLAIILTLALASLPRKNRTKLEHTYVDYLNQNFCPKTMVLDQAQIASFKESRLSSNPIEINLDQIIKGNLSSVTFSFSFFLNIAVYVFCFIVLCVNLRRLSRYNKIVVKSNIRMTDEFNVDTNNNKKNIVFKGLVLVLLIFNFYYSIRGLQISGEAEQGLRQTLCGIINFPNNFARKDVSTSLDQYTNFNDYQYEASSLRQFFTEVKLNYTDLLKQANQNNFTQRTPQFVTALKDSQHEAFISSVEHTLQLVDQIKNGSKFMGASINYLRQLLYWVKGSLTFGQGYINSIYRIQKMPTLVRTIISQLYQVIMLCAFGSFIAIIFMSIKSTAKEALIIKYIIIGLSFSALISLFFSFLGSTILPIPSAACNILSNNPNRAAVVGPHIKFAEQSMRATLIQFLERIGAQSDGNMAFTNEKLYENIQKLQRQFKIISIYAYKEVEDKLVSQQPGLQKEIHAYFQFYPTFVTQLGAVNAIFDKIAASVAKDGDFGRLTLRPLGEYIQNFERNLCEVNLSIWSKNTSTLFVCGIISLAILICLALYLRNKLKGQYVQANQDEGVEMSSLQTA